MIDIVITVTGWVVIIMFTVFARYHIQKSKNVPTDMDRFRSWRYRRAIKAQAKRARRLRQRKHQQQSRRGHDPQAYGCIYWTGDRKGVDLRAICPVCGLPDIGGVA